MRYILIKGENEKHQNMNYGSVWTEELRLIFIFFFIFLKFSNKLKFLFFQFIMKKYLFNLKRNGVYYKIDLIFKKTVWNL